MCLLPQDLPNETTGLPAVILGTVGPLECAAAPGGGLQVG